jgi:N-acetylglucosaminyl-diphospho-decaprenol L-rhamnosyltransferase
MPLLIVIVSWNARDDLERCLQSLHQTPPGNAHTIAVVDNASADGSADMTSARFPSVRLIRADTNLGFARANNRAIREVPGDPILLLNPDTIVPAGAIDRLMAHLQQHPDAAAVGPRLVDGEGHVEISSGLLPSPRRELVRKALSRLHAQRLQPFTRWVDRAARQPRRVDWVTGAAMLVRREAAEAVGLLDEEYELYWEDIDFCAALRARGWRVLFTPDAEIVHLRGRSASSAPLLADRAYRVSQLRFYRKHRRFWAPAVRLYQRLRYH